MLRTTRKKITQLAIITLACASIGCSLKKPSTETPAPIQQSITKSFFGEAVQMGTDNNKATIRNKSFLCGWAQIAEPTGTNTEHNTIIPSHCNIQFDIQEHALVGKLVNPSFPDDPNRWRTVLTIPIKRHYYYEAKKDSYGRDTNEMIMNDTRSDWSARPNMELDLRSLTINEQEWNLFPGAGAVQVSSVTDVEWDNTNNFLGFTVEAGTTITRDGAAIQTNFWGPVEGRFRINFLAFDHNSSFAKTPFDDRNNKFFNTLHVVGQKVEGVSPVKYAAHWDLSKKHDIYLVNFPAEYKQIGRDVIELWNDQFQAIGQPRAFVPKDGDSLKYAFDLRYSSINWVSDRKISQNAPLGIGMANADVRNGEIMWAGITLWGGLLENYVKRYSPSETSSASSSVVPAFFANIGDLMFSHSAQQPTMPPGMTRLASLDQGRGFDRIARGMKNHLDVLASSSRSAARSSTSPAATEAQAALMEQAQSNADALIMTLKEQIESRQSDLQQLFQKYSMRSLILGSPSMNRASSQMQTLYGSNWNSMTPTERAAQMDQRAHSLPTDFVNHALNASIDSERTFANSAPSWALASEALGDKISYPQALRAVVKDLIAHEYGHILGLGHNFKENILPEPDSIPKKYYDKLKAAADNDYTNFSTVMGYKHGKTDLVMKYEDIKPGPHDALVLRYLYNREYSTFAKGDDDFKYKRVPNNGIIPDAPDDDSGAKTTYFPACNDLEASLSYDPLCNRWDRGSEAESILKTYIDDIEATKVSRAYAFTDAKGSDPGGTEMYLWNRSLDSMGRIRLFYDDMRKKYVSAINEIAQSPNDLLDFSTACATPRTEDVSNDTLKKLFQRNPGLHSLCRANKLAVEKLGEILSERGSDSIVMDWDNYRFSAGMGGGDLSSSMSQMWGSWRQMTSLPFKMGALNALTTPASYMYMDGWMYPAPRFSGDDAKFVYSTLYPKEFTKAIASAMEKNMTFAGGDTQSPTLGRTALALGSFLMQSRDNNEFRHNFQQNYLETIQNQTKFRFDVVAVLLEAVQKPQDKSKVTGFQGKIYDMNSGTTMATHETYVLPNGKLIVRGGDKTFLYPISEIKFFTDTSAYVMAYRVEYDEGQPDDTLWSTGVKASFYKLHKSVIENCIYGQDNGLASYFKSAGDSSGSDTPASGSSPTPAATAFTGFDVQPGIALDREKQIQFQDSIKKAFDGYYASNLHPDRKTCEASLSGVGMIVSAAAALNGYWLPELDHYTVK